jgi:hypothetical protein
LLAATLRGPRVLIFYGYSFGSQLIQILISYGCCSDSQMSPALCFESWGGWGVSRARIPRSVAD